MTERSLHRVLLRTPFRIAFDVPDLGQNDVQLLRNHGTWLQALSEGRVEPFTLAQVRFLKVVAGELAPTSRHETIWVKYLTARKRHLEVQSAELERQYIAAKASRTQKVRPLIERRTLSYNRLQRLLDSALEFDFTAEEIESIKSQLAAAAEKIRWSGAQVVYSATDGQD